MLHPSLGLGYLRLRTLGMATPGYVAIYACFFPNASASSSAAVTAVNLGYPLDAGPSLHPVVIPISLAGERVGQLRRAPAPGSSTSPSLPLPGQLALPRLVPVLSEESGQDGRAEERSTQPKGRQPVEQHLSAPDQSSTCVVTRPIISSCEERDIHGSSSDYHPYCVHV
jgi:hypothetical protein